jgi:hypothetical protein
VYHKSILAAKMLINLCMRLRVLPMLLSATASYSQSISSPEDGSTMTTAIPLPAPWHLHGKGCAVLVRRGNKKVGLCMWVDYQRSDAGEYYELLWIPDIAPAQGCPSIERIYVSNQRSVDEGRRNWGIPKELAYFQTEYPHHAVSCRIETPEGEMIASLTIDARGRDWPIKTSWLPEEWLTLQQDWQGQRFYYAPKAHGRVRRAKVIDWRFDARYFPDLSKGKVLAAFMVDSFDMVFPPSIIEAIRQAG